MRAFSLIELLVVIAVALILAALLLPVMTQLRENANRLVCQSNQRQLGIGMMLYHQNSNDWLPLSNKLRRSTPQDMMAAYDGTAPDPDHEPTYWDGIGRIYQQQYCAAPECFYCPSHRGEHTLERYREHWLGIPTTSADPTNPEPQHGYDAIFTNYHYGGDIEWKSRVRRRLEDGEKLVLLTDGLRTALDFNHEVGMNVLRGDGSIVWVDQVDDVYEMVMQGVAGTESFDELWNLIEDDK